MAYGNTGYGQPAPPPGYQPPPPSYGVPSPPPGAPGGPPPIAPTRLDIGDTMSRAFEILKDNFMEFYIYYAVIGIVAVLFQIISSIMVPAPTSVTDPAQAMQSIPAQVVSTSISLVIAIIQLMWTAGIVRMTHEAMTTGSTNKSTGFQAVKQYGGIVAVTSIIVGLLIGFGLLFCCIPGIIFCYWWMFAIVAVVIEGVGVGDAMARSKEFATGYDTLGFAIVIIVVTILINFVAIIIQTAVVMPLVVIDLRIATIVGAIVGGIVSWAVAPYPYIAISYHYIKGKNLDKPGAGEPPQQSSQPPPGYNPSPPSPPGYNPPPPAYPQQQPGYGQQVPPGYRPPPPSY